MKEDILDVLMYLFENYLDNDLPLTDDFQILKDELIEAGFHTSEISKAFAWLEGLVEQKEVIKHQEATSIRVYLPEESEKLDLECRGFILYLEQIGVLDAANRELVIDRVMALETDDFDLDQLKWVILMVLFNQPSYEAAFTWMENFVYEEEMAGYLH